MTLDRRRTRATVTSAFALGALLIGGCDDQRASPAGPTSGDLDGDTVFSSALFTATVLRYQNDAVQEALGMIRDGVFALTQSSGDGKRFFERSATDPLAFIVYHGDAVDGFFDEIAVDEMPETPYLWENLGVNGWMRIRFLETSPGLHYVIDAPFAWGVDGVRTFARGLKVDGVDWTTPGSPALPVEPVRETIANSSVVVAWTGAGGGVECFLENGTVRQMGVVRVEDRQRQVLVVQDLDVVFDLASAYDPNETPALAPWPSGQYEAAAVLAQQFGSTTSRPVDVMLDGNGGAVFFVGDRQCDTDLTDPENGNPCTLNNGN